MMVLWRRGELSILHTVLLFLLLLGVLLAIYSLVFKSSLLIFSKILPGIFGGG